MSVGLVESKLSAYLSCILARVVPVRDRSHSCLLSIGGLPWLSHVYVAVRIDIHWCVCSCPRSGGQSVGREGRWMDTQMRHAFLVQSLTTHSLPSLPFAVCSRVSFLRRKALRVGGRAGVKWMKGVGGKREEVWCQGGRERSAG